LGPMGDFKPLIDIKPFNVYLSSIIIGNWQKGKVISRAD